MKFRTLLCAFVLSLLVLGGIKPEPARGAGCPRTVNRPFRVFDGLLLTGRPDLSALGMEPVHIVDRGIWRDAANRLSPPDPALIRRYIESLPDDGAPIVLDFENYRLSGADQEAAFALGQLRRIATMFRAAAPRRNLGFYDALPIRDYWRAIRPPSAPEYRAWQRESDRLAPLTRNVDMLFPSVYTFYPDSEGWVAYASAQICEARRLSSKPVYLFLWPQYHNSAEGEYIDGRYWRLQLETAYRLADGVVIWGGLDIRTNAFHRWDPQQPWWQETERFLRDRHIGRR